MADQKISELIQINIGDLADADEFVIADASASDNKSITWGEMTQSSPDDATAGRLMKVGGFGVGSDNPPVVPDFEDVQFLRTGFYSTGASTLNLPTELPHKNGQVVMTRSINGNGVSMVWRANYPEEDADTWERRWTPAGGFGPWVRYWHTGNTTVDGSGFLLEASPIVRVYTDNISEPNKPVNATLTHTETGVYVLSGVPPLATEGWQVRTPEDMNGNKVVAIDPPEYDSETGTLTLRTYDLLWHEGRLVPGDPMDVPSDYFVMLRFHEEPEEEQP